MNFIKKYKGVILVVLLILILIIIRLISPGYFKPDAKKWAEPSMNGTNIITVENTGNLPGEKLIINIDNEPGETQGIKGDLIFITADSVFSELNLRTIKNHNGPVLLNANEEAVAARIWMVLSQMGLTNIYILSAEEREILKYKFRPDTLIRPELY